MNTSSPTFSELLNKVDTTNFKQVDYAVSSIWFLTDVKGRRDCLMKDVLQCFQNSNLSVPNPTLLKRKLQSSKEVVAGFRPKSFRIHRDALERYRSIYVSLISPGPSPEEVIRERLNVLRTPFLTHEDVDNAYKMAELYVAIHCLENSVRSLIRNILSKTLGKQWWDKAASEPMRRKLEDRKSREAKNRWLPSRGADELNYVDWSDLVTLIRKYHKEFENFIPDIKFVELRLEELENLRNTIAHNGVLPDEELARVELALKDWCKQVS